MADRCYLEKCRDRLYPEFVAGGLATQARAPTARAGGVRLGRGSGASRPRYSSRARASGSITIWAAATHYAQQHFGGQNLYLEELNKNIQFAQEIGEESDPSLLKRMPPETLNARSHVTARKRAFYSSTSFDSPRRRRMRRSCAQRLELNLPDALARQAQVPRPAPPACSTSWLFRPKRRSITVRCLSFSCSSHRRTSDSISCVCKPASGLTPARRRSIRRSTASDRCPAARRARPCARCARARARTSSAGLPSRCAMSSIARLALAVRLQMALGAQHQIQFLDHVHRQPYRARLVHDRALDVLAYPPGGVGGEAEAALGIEFLQRVHQPEIALLDQVEQRHAAVEVVLGDVHHQAQIALDHLLPRGEIPLAPRGARSAAPPRARAAG